MKREVEGKEIGVSNVAGSSCWQHDNNNNGDGNHRIAMYKMIMEDGKIWVYSYKKDGKLTTLLNGRNLENSIVLSYLLARSNRYIDDKANHWDSQVQFALWSAAANNSTKSTFQQDFMNSVNSLISGDDNDIFVSHGANGLGEYGSAHATAAEQQAVKDLLRDAKEFASAVTGYTKMSNNTNQDGIKTYTDTNDNTVIGPFKVSYYERKVGNTTVATIDMDNFKLLDQSGTEISSSNWSLGTFNKTTKKFTKETKMPNDTNFYIRINKQVTSVSKLVVAEKHLGNRAEFYLTETKDGAQRQGLAGYATTGMKKDTLDIPVSIIVSGKLRITKVDADDENNKLDATFRLYTTINKKKYYFDVDNKVLTETKCDFDVEEERTITGIPEGTYTLEEVQSPYGYKLSLQDNSEKIKSNIEIKTKETTSVTVKNKKYGDLIIMKVDSTTDQYIPGIEFTIRHSTKGYIKSYTKGNPSTVTFTSDATKAKKFKTNSSGIIKLENIPIGTYYAKEVSVSNDNITVSGITAPANKFYKSSGDEISKTVISNDLEDSDYLKDSIKRIYRAASLRNTTDSMTAGNYIAMVYKRITNKTITADIKAELYNVMYKKQHTEGLESVTSTYLNKTFEQSGFGNNEINALINRIFKKYITENRIDSLIESNDTIKAYLKKVFEEDGKVTKTDSFIQYYAYVAQGIYPFRFTNNMGGRLQIGKVDADNTSKTLKATFRLYTKVGNTIYYYNDSTKTFSTTDSTFVVDGSKTIGNLPALSYTVQETAAPDGYNISLQNGSTKNVDVTVGGTTSITIGNKQYGSLKIIKKDKDETSLTIPGIEFIIKDKSKGYIKSYTSGNPSTIQYSANETEAKKFKTNSNGEIALQNIPLGTYIAKEVSVSSDNITVSGITAGADKFYQSSGESKELAVSANNTAEFEFTNVMGGNLTITKKDADTGAAITASFRLYTTINNVKYYYNDSTGEFSTTDTSFEVSGSKTISRLPQLTYTLEETSAPTGYDLSLQTKVFNVSVTLGNTKQQNVPNIKYGKIEITKYVQGTTESLSGAQFEIYTEKRRDASKKATIYRKDSSGNMQSTTSGTYTTGADGKVTTDYLRTGTYWLYESKEPDYFEVIDSTDNGQSEIEDAKWIEVKVEADATVTVTKKTIYNRRRLIDLSGYVWEDVNTGKTSTVDNQYDSDDNLYEHVRVRLIDKRTGAVVKNDQGTDLIAYTNADGSYKFTRVYVYDIANYYVEFEYNGISYYSIPVNLTVDNGSKATEGTNRTTMDNKFVTINSDGAYDTDGNKTTQLLYNSANNVSTLRYVANSETRDEQLVKGNSKSNYPIYGANNDRSKMNSNYMITADTWQSYGGGITTADAIRKNNVKEITNINLGLKERERPNLSVLKDIDNVMLSINGYSHIYKYNKKTEDYFDPNNNNGIGLGVSFKSKYGSMSYQRPIYKADIDFESAEEDKNLNVYLTYRISMINSATNIEAKINSLVDYYDAKYEQITGVGVKIGANGIVEQTLRFSPLTSDVNGYSKIQINTDKIVGNQQVETIYVQFKLSKQKVKEILYDSDGNKKNVVEPLDNMVEINSYTSYYADNTNKIYGGIDQFSAPGNARPDNGATYEADTDSAPAMNLAVAAARSVTGKVFKDNSTIDNNIHTDQVRQGSGKYEEGEEGIGNVEVKLIPKTGTNTTYVTKTVSEDGWYTVRVDKPEGSGGTATITTTRASEGTEGAIQLSKGDYCIKEFAPDEYQIIYTWGDKEHPVQNWKCTIYDDKNRYNTNSNDKTWYRKDVDIRYQDALDDYSLRQQIDQEIGAEGTEVQIEQINALYEKFKNTYDNNTNELTTKMNSTTLPFGVGVEYDDDLTGQTVTNVDNNSNDIMKKQEIKNIDFGITLRPKQEISLDKNLSELKIVLPTKDTLVEARIVKDENGNKKLETASEYVTYLPESGTNKGTLKVEIDNELIQNSTLYLKYDFVVTNISEKDYSTSDFYLFGITDGTTGLVTIQPIKLVDYLEGSSNKQEQWTTLNSSEKQKLFNDGLLNGELKDIVLSKEVLVNAVEISNSKLLPNNSVGTQMETTKLLTTNDEISLGNDAEIIVSKKSGGSMYATSIPGNYNPTDSATRQETHETDDSRAEDTSVTPPTGENRNYTMIISISIGILAIVGAGVVIIKKKILHK